MHVVEREVASVDRALGRTEVQVDDYREGVLLHNLREPCKLFLVRDLPEAERPNAVVEHFRFHVYDFRARIADSSENAAPVGILAEPARLCKRRLRDGTRGALGVALRFRSLHGDSHELRSALAVRRHLAGKRNAHRLERGAESVEVLAGGVDLAIPGLARRKDKKRVVSRFIAVDDEAVEAAANGEL